MEQQQMEDAIALATITFVGAISGALLYYS